MRSIKWENEIHKIHRIFEIQTDHLIPGQRPDLVLIKMKKEYIDLGILLFQLTTQWKLMREKMNKYVDVARELKNCETWRRRW